MNALIIGGVRPFHKRIAELGAKSTLLIPKQAATEADLSGPYQSIHVMANDANETEYIAIAKALHQTRKFTAVCSFHEHFQKFSIPIAESLGLPTISQEAYEAAADKFLMRKKLREAGVDSAEAFIVKTDAEANAAFEKIGQTTILKPVSGTGSDRIFKIKAVSDLKEIADKVFTENSIFVMEPFHEGPEYSVEAISENGEHRILAITLKYKDSECFVEQGHVVPAPLPAADTNKIKAYCIAVLNALNITDGPSHTELVLTEAGPRIIETHTRAGGDGIVELVEFATEMELISLIAKQSLGVKVLDQIPETLDFKRSAAVWYEFPKKYGRVQSVAGISEAEKENGVKAVRILKGVGAEHRKVNHSFERSACAFATADSSEKAIQTCRLALDKIKFDIQTNA